MEYHFSMQAIIDGFWNGFLVTFIAGAGGLGIKVMFRTFKTITGG